jgi:RNA polymerase sigma-70 factor (ECF subfamily)
MDPIQPESGSSITGVSKRLNELEKPPSKHEKEATKGQLDEPLLERIRGGDQSAFRELFERYHRRAFAVALGVVKNQQDALDIVQDAFVKVYKHIDGFQGSSSFYTWLYRIIMNLSIDHIRKNRRTTEFDDRVEHNANDAAEMVSPSLENSNPRKNVDRKELSEQIQQALNTLPEYHRAVILLREVEGMSYEEMSKVLKVPKGTIMSRLFHARRKMQECLQPYLDGDIEIEEGER